MCKSNIRIGESSSNKLPCSCYNKVTSLARVRQNTEAPPSPEASYFQLTAERLIEVVKIENVAIEVCVHVLLVEMLLAVQRKLFIADGTDPPVRLDVPFETALLELRWEDDLAQRTALMDVSSV